MTTPPTPRMSHPKPLSFRCSASERPSAALRRARRQRPSVPFRRPSSASRPPPSALRPPPCDSVSVLHPPSCALILEASSFCTFDDGPLSISIKGTQRRQCRSGFSLTISGLAASENPCPQPHSSAIRCPPPYPCNTIALPQKCRHAVSALLGLDLRLTASLGPCTQF